jgi:hypothetical protein
MTNSIKSQKLWFLLNRFDRSKEEELLFFEEDKKKYPFFYLLDWNERFNLQVQRRVALKSSYRNQYYASIYDIEIESPVKTLSTSYNQIQLIDQFLEKLPSLTRVKKTGQEELESEIDLSESTWNLPASETFASILEKQGKFQQAIDVYEKLSLSKPEKSHYFATRISELSLKINN